MFSYPWRKAEPVQVELVGQFTSEESVRIMGLRQQFDIYPDRFKLDINFRRLEFARWLVIHGYLDEWRESQADQVGEALDLRNPKCLARCT